MERRQIQQFASEFEERKRQHEERKRNLNRDHSHNRSTGETESNDESYESLDVDEEIQKHKSPVKFSILEGNATK